MAKERFTIEQIINHLGDADVLLARTRKVGEVSR